MWQTINMMLVLLMLLVATNSYSKDLKQELFEAVQQKNNVTVSHLLSKGTDVNSREQGGMTCLMMAAYYGSSEIVKTLLEHDADVNAINDTGGTALIAAVVGGGHIEVIKILLANGADVNIKSNDGPSLIAAAMTGNIEVVKILIDGGADIHATDGNGHTALLKSAMASDSKIVKLLLDNGADANDSDPSSSASILLLIEMKENQTKYSKVINLLKQHGGIAASIKTWKF